ncbi:MAG TPA: hypothetical protein IAC12_04700 [Candidatus Aphodovivens avistercoris]|nr:hypothetical protein [Candidatus Aphodovivens avistercoris]
MSAKVRVCKKCSGVSPKDFKGTVDKSHIRSGCFGACAKKHPELKGKAYAKVDGKLVVRDSKKKLVKAVAAAL